MEIQETNYEHIASTLNFELKIYDGLTKLIVQTTNRCHSIGVDPAYYDLLIGERDKEGKLKTQGLNQIKDKQARRLLKEVQDDPIWQDWLSKVPGVGPFIAAKLIRLYRYKFVAICSECKADLDDDFKCNVCKKSAKGMGNLEFRVELRDFPTISSWWHFMGRHNDESTGKMARRKSEEKSDWSSEGRRIGFLIKEAFNKFGSDHKYKAYAEKRKRYREGTHPDSTKGHRHNMAWNEAVKLFLSHFWQVARMLSDDPLTDPWCVAHGGHDKEHIIPPYYFNGNGG